MLVPRAYFIEPDVARIPLECANGMDITFTESDAPDLYPARFGFSFGAVPAPGGTQYELLEKIPDASFGSSVPLR